MTSGPRRYFQSWVLKQEDPDWPRMPLTHISAGMGARDIISDGAINPGYCEVMKEARAYMFYGRAAYRIGSEKTVPFEAFCPFCFVFDGALVKRAKTIIPFDTGAYHRRIFKYHDGDDVNIDDFSILDDKTTLNRLIKCIFRDREKYAYADRTVVPQAHEICGAGDFDVRIYLSMIRADGRNEPDDRVSSIEVSFSDPIPLQDSLKCVIVPHTMLDEDDESTEWFRNIQTSGVEVRAYKFIPMKPPEYYHALMESEFISLLEEWKLV